MRRCIRQREIFSIVNFDGAVGSSHCLVIRGREGGVVGSSRCRPNNDGACHLSSGATWLLNCIRRLLCNPTWSLHPPHCYHTSTIWEKHTTISNQVMPMYINMCACVCVRTRVCVTGRGTSVIEREGCMRAAWGCPVFCV